jgi:hypothetical protein
VDDVEIRRDPAHHEVAKHGVEEPGVPRIVRRNGDRCLHTVHDQGWRAFGLIPEAQHANEMTAFFDRRELAGQIFDVDARAAVDVGWIFIGQDADPHAP